MHKIFNFIASLRLTVACLSVAVVLVFVGTLAQVELGLYEAQARFFRELFVYWQVPGTSWKIPVLPGGWLLGGILLVNLVAAHFKRFVMTQKKIGIFLIHFGLVLLLLGQFLTEVFQVETAMRLTEGESSNYAVSQRDNELVFIDSSNDQSNQVVAIPEALLAKGKKFDLPGTPLTLSVTDYSPNGRIQKLSTGEKAQATEGLGTEYVIQSMPKVTGMNSRDLPYAVAEISSKGKSLGTWVFGSGFLQNDGEPVYQDVEVDGKTYQAGMRFRRYYKPFSMELVDFKHDLYEGTTRPRNFSSDLRIRNAATGEDRQVLIYMNSPLRYNGETYYQGSFDEFDPRVSILQVVHNPAWITPYVACTLMGAGLLVQFLMHLVGFSRKRKARGAGSEGKTGAPVMKEKKRRDDEVSSSLGQDETRRSK